MTNGDLFYPNQKRPRRILALFFPQLSVDLHRRRTKTAAFPLALYEKIDSTLRIAALDHTAKALGLYEGQPLAEARAIVPALCIAPIDHAGDAADFERLLSALLRYSPLVGSAGFGAAFIDLAGCEKLFGGDEAIAEDVLFRLRCIGFAAHGAVAATPGCAYALARCDSFSSAKTQKTSIVSAGNEGAALALLPVAALRIDRRTVDDLKSLGLKTIGSLMARPRKALARRFGEALLRRLDETTSALFEPISPIAPPSDHSAAAVLAEPVTSVEAALLVAEKLARALSKKLETEGLGARRFEFSLFRLDMSLEQTTIVLGAPSRNPETILRLLRLKLEKGDRQIDPGFGFESFRLSAFETAPIAAREQDAFGEPCGEEGLKDRLVNHLGSAVFHLHPVANHIPERAEAKAPALETSIPWPDESAERPLLLLDPPEPILATAPLPDGPPASFRWRRLSYRVMRAAGPERILGEWRKREDFLRDYYRIEDEEGRRYWVFREGLYEASAKWFLHGFFA